MTTEFAQYKAQVASVMLDITHDDVALRDLSNTFLSLMDGFIADTLPREVAWNILTDNGWNHGWV